jgi:hypothetical protein
VAANVDRIVLDIVAEADRHDMRLAVAASRGDAPYPLALQIGDLSGCKVAHDASFLIWY